MFPGAAARPLLAASSTGHRLSVIASSYQGTQRPTRSCPSRRPGREQRVLSLGGWPEEGEAKTAQPRLSSRQSPYWVWARAVPQQRRTSAAGFSKCSSSESELSCAGNSRPTGMLQPSTNQRAKSHCHSLLPTS